MVKTQDSKMDESSIHLPVINAWNKQMEKVKFFIEQNSGLELHEIERRFTALQKEMSDEIKGIIFANYKEVDFAHQKKVSFRLLARGWKDRLPRFLPARNADPPHPRLILGLSQDE